MIVALVFGWSRQWVEVKMENHPVTFKMPEKPKLRHDKKDPTQFYYFLDGPHEGYLAEFLNWGKLGPLAHTVVRYSPGNPKVGDLLKAGLDEVFVKHQGGHFQSGSFGQNLGLPAYFANYSLPGDKGDQNWIARSYFTSRGVYIFVANEDSNAQTFFDSIRIPAELRPRQGASR